MKAVRHMKSTGRVSSGAITPSWVKNKFNLPGSALSVKKHIFKPMKWKYYLRTRKPGVPAKEIPPVTVRIAGDRYILYEYAGVSIRI